MSVEVPEVSEAVVHGPANGSAPEAAVNAGVCDTQQNLQALFVTLAGSRPDHVTGAAPQTADPRRA